MIKAGINGWELGTVLWPFEVGNRTISTITLQGTTTAYGLYGLTFNPSQNKNTLSSFLQVSRFKDFFNGLQPGTTSFNAKWLEAATEYTDQFEDDQKNYNKAAYYNVLDSALKAEGFFADNFGPAVKDTVYLISKLFGPSRTDVILDPFQNVNVENLTDFDVVNFICEYAKRLQPLPNINKQQGFLAVLSIPKPESKNANLGEIIDEEGEYFIVKKTIERINTPLPPPFFDFKTARDILRRYTSNFTFDITSTDFRTYYEEYLNGTRGREEVETIKILKRNFI